MPVRDAYGRRVVAVRNGHSFIGISDDRRSAEFIVDFENARRIADALATAQPFSGGDNHGQPLAVVVVPERPTEAGVQPARLLFGKPRHEPHGTPQQPTGPWVLSVEQGVALASEILAAIGPTRAATPVVDVEQPLVA